MPPLTNARIEKGKQSSRGQSYYIKAEEGYVNIDHISDNEEYKIRFYRTHDTYQGHGYGKELLQLAKEHAKSIGAKVITSTTIVSDESAGAMSAVFGYENLTSRTDPRSVTSLVDLFSRITLDYTIQETDPPLREDVTIRSDPRPHSTSPIYRYLEQQAL